MIDDCAVNVIVPYNDEAKDIIKRLNGAISYGEALELQRKAQKYTVGVYDHIFNILAESDAIIRIKSKQDRSDEVVFALKDEFYDNNIGITVDGAPQEVLFC